MTTVLKVIFIGEGGVGKTCLLKRALEDIFYHGMTLTVGADFAVRDVTYGDWHATLQFWDLGGQLRFRELISFYSKGAHLAIAVFDISNRFSMFQLERWITKFLLAQGDIPLIVVGNKIDLRKDIPQLNSVYVSKEEGLALAQKYNAPYIEASAARGDGVEDIFNLVTRLLAERYPKPPSPLDIFKGVKE